MRRALALVLCAACGSSTPGDTVPPPRPIDAAPAGPSAEQAAAADRLALAYLALTVDSIEPAPATELAVIGWAVLGAGDTPPFTADPVDNADAMRATAAAIVPGTEWRAIAAMAASHEAAHAVLLDRPALENVMAFATGAPYAGPGFVAHHDATGAAVVSDVYPGGPAETAGLLAGDTIVLIDGAPPGASLLLPMLFHAAEAVVELEVDRAGMQRTIRIELAVQAFPVVTARVLNKAGIIRVHAVVTSTDPSRDAATLVRAAIAALDSRKVRGLVLDLRGCPGGEGVAALASVLTTNDPVLLLRDIVGAETPWPRAGERAAWPHFIDVLVDDQTGSAAEMVAFAMREQGGIRVIGQPTAGEMTVPGIVDLGEDRVLVYPAQRVVGPISHELPRGGRMHPDQLVASRTAADILAGKDAQLDAAIKWATRRRP